MVSSAVGADRDLQGSLEPGALPERRQLAAVARARGGHLGSRRDRHLLHQRAHLRGASCRSRRRLRWPPRSGRRGRRQSTRTRRASASSASSGAATTARSARRRARGTAWRGGCASGIGLTVAMQAMNGLDQLQPVAGHGPGRRGPARPRPRDLPRAAVRAAHRRGAHRPRPARRRAGAGLPALVPQADGRARLAERGLRARGRVRERVLARDAGRRALRADRLRALLLDDRR